MHGLETGVSQRRVSSERLRVQVDYDHCSYCGACVAVCPPDCITLHDATLIIDPEACTVCRRCIPACPTGALTLEADR
jgi:NAD-dependent dihydropyrimidine dehydrogenase PreA subunit